MIASQRFDKSSALPLRANPKGAPMRRSRIVLLAAGVGVLTLQGAALPAITFNKDVLPILQEKCQSCHRPGQVAPMSFLTYREARPWAKAIKAAVATRKMPPWFAEPQVGHFSNDR